MITADPGCGKSVLARAFVDEKLGDNGTATVCYYFFKDNEEQNKVAPAFCAVLHQLFCTNTGLVGKYAAGPIQRYGKGLTNNLEELWRILLSVAQDEATRDVICVFDALDECKESDRNYLIEKVTAFYNDSKSASMQRSRLKFFLTSRHYTDIEHCFQRYVNDLSTVHLAGENESAQISEEIDKVIDVEVVHIGKQRNLSDEVQIALQQRLKNVAHRTYLWLHLILQELQSALGTTSKKLLKAIESLPDTIEEAYQKILMRCHNQKDAKRLLQVILAAREPLTVGQIDVALEVRTSGEIYEDLDTEGETNRKVWIRSACGLFVSIVDRRVYLIHETAREFLLQRNPGERLSQHLTWKHSLNVQSAELLMAEICASYLQFCANRFEKDDLDFNIFGEETKLDEDARKAFMVYSALNWAKHIRRVSDSSLELTNKAVALCSMAKIRHLLCRCPPTFVLPYGDLEELQDRPPLFWAVSFGLPMVVQHLLEQGDEHPELSKHVWLAAAESLTETGPKIFALLLDAQRRGCGLSGSIWTAAASNYRNGYGMLSLLLEKQGGDTKLSERVLIDIVKNQKSRRTLKLLLDRHGDKVSITGNLLEAVAGNWVGHESMELLLQQEGHEVNITESIVLAAAWNIAGNQMIKLLLELRGDQIEITESIVIAAVQSQHGRQRTEYLLQERNDQILITESIVMAACGGVDGVEVMKLLFEQRSKDFSITESVMLAASKSEAGSDILQLLLDQRGHEITITGRVLQAVAEGVDVEKCVKLLLKRRGDEVTITEDILVAAANHESPELMKILLDQRGDEVVITDAVIIAAATNRSDDGQMLKLLLDQRGNEITTRSILLAAAHANDGRQLMETIFRQRQHDFVISEPILLAIVKGGNPYGMLELLLELPGVEISITEPIMILVVQSYWWGYALTALLFSREDLEIDITESVLQSAMESPHAEDLIKLLRERRDTPFHS